MQDLTAISVTFGLFDTKGDLTVPLGTEQLINPTNCLAIMEDDTIIGFAVQHGDQYIFDNSEELDGEALRSTIMELFRSQWSRILLSSIDIDEIDDEADMPYLQFHLSDEPDLSFASGDASEYNGWIGVHSVRGNFSLEKSDILEKFALGEMESSASIPMSNFGEINDFFSDTEMFVMFEAS